MNFGIKLAQNEYFRSKTEKVNISIEFCKFELVMVPNISLNWQFWIFGLNLPNKYVLHTYTWYTPNYICRISFTNSGTSVVSENPKALKILPFNRKYTITWPKIRKVWLNPKKCGRSKEAFPIRFIEGNVIRICNKNINNQ